MCFAELMFSGQQQYNFGVKCDKIQAFKSIESASGGEPQYQNKSIIDVEQYDT